MRSFSGHLLVAILAVLFLGTGLAACAGSATDVRGSGTGSGDRDRDASVDAGDHLVVRENGRVLADLTLPRVQSLPQLEIVTPQSRGAQLQKGPTVRSVLDAAGAANVASVRVEGRDPAQTLTAAELTEQVILNVTKRNTLKLAGANLGRDRWVRDVTALVVNP